MKLILAVFEVMQIRFVQVSATAFPVSLEGLCHLVPGCIVFSNGFPLGMNHERKMTMSESTFSLYYANEN